MTDGNMGKCRGNDFISAGYPAAFFFIKLYSFI